LSSNTYYKPQPARQILLGLPLRLAPSTSYITHWFIHSLTSFHNI